MASFKVYHGAPKPLVAVGGNQVRLLQFAAAHAGWHSYASDKATRNAIAGLVRRGSIVLNNYSQFAIAYGQFKMQALES